MSSFGGILAEPELSFMRIDNFENDIMNGKVYLLSHFHSDHFRGLFEANFQKMINQTPEVVIYCTNITKNLILAKANCKIQPDKILEMNLNSPYVLFCNNMSVIITALPAGHCPGSSMFCIEFKGTRIIYTGDIRMSAKELQCFTALHDSEGFLKPINVLYLDTTFCDPKWLYFPSREQSLADIETIIGWWLAKDEQKLVGIRYISPHGLEWILRPIANKNNTKIWVLDERAFNNYSGYPELSPFLSKVKEACKIHLCRVTQGSGCSVCNMFKKDTLTIKPCAMSFDFDILQKKRFYQWKDLLKVAYATHCSFVELTSVVKYLKPKTIVPCVIPSQLSIDKVMANLCLNVQDHLRNMLSKSRHDLQPAPETDRGPLTSSSAQELLNLLGESHNKIHENPIEKVLKTANYDSTLSFTWKRSVKTIGNLVPYNIFWEKVSSSDPFGTQDSSKTKIVKLPLFHGSFSSNVIKDDLPRKSSESATSSHLPKSQRKYPQCVNLGLQERMSRTETRETHSFTKDDASMPVMQLCVASTVKKSSSVLEESLYNQKRARENSFDAGEKGSKIIKNIGTTEDVDSSSDTDTSDNFHHLDTPPY